MPYLNIHWKGYPHRHLPQIRVASTPSVSVRNCSSTAAKQVTGAPLGRLFGQERKKQRFFRVRRRRGRGSRASAAVQAKGRTASTAAQARRRAAQRARQNIEVFGWDAPNAELASKATTEVYFGSRQSTPRPPKELKSAALPRNQLETESVIPRTDGPSSTIIRQPAKPTKSEPRYSLTHVAELPANPGNRRKFSFESDRLGNDSTRRVGEEYAHTSRNSRTYDSRIDPKTRAGVRTKSAVPQPQSAQQASREEEPRKISSQKTKKQSVASPEFWEAVNSFALQPKKQRSDPPSVKSVVQSVFSGATRTPSQIRALRRFTREIELYLQAARTLPKQSLVPSITTTTISTHTILEFKPYQSQFRSAGLAVTSEEQRGTVRIQEPPYPPPTPPKDEKWEKMGTISRKSKADADAKKKEEKLPSFASGSTGTTIVGFTPPHEKSYPRPKTDRRPPSLESNHTVVGFTPPYEMMITPQSQPPSIEPRPSSKKSLPWLRRPDQSPEASPTTKMSLKSVNRDQQPRASTPLHGWVPAFEIVDKPPPVERDKMYEDLANKYDGAPPPSSASRRWRETKASPQRSTPENIKQDMSAQPIPIPSDIPRAFHWANNYIDTATQANASDIDSPDYDTSNSQADQSATDRAAIPTGCNKSFPPSPKKCRGDCSQATGGMVYEAPQQKPSSPSRVSWQRVESCTQTDEMNSEVEEGRNEITEIQGNDLSLPSTVPTDDESNSSPLTSRTARASNLARAAPEMRHSNKIIEDGKYPPVEKDNEIENEFAVSPNRQPPPILLVCSQCVRPVEIRLSDLAPKYTSEEPKFEAERAFKNFRTHTGSSRSSMLCQLCFPSRRSIRPIIPAGPLTYPEELQTATQIPQYLNSEEEKEMRKRIAQGAIEEYAKLTSVADPMKRPSMARLKLKPAPNPQPALRRNREISTSSRTYTPPATLHKAVFIATACPLDDVSSSTSFDNLTQKTCQITDKQVFRGLHVATAAACDEEVNKWIEEITGTGVRQFLADLSAFEGLGVNTLASVAKGAARQRKEQLMAWERLRERTRVTQSREVEVEVEVERDGEQAQGDEDHDGLKGKEFTGDQILVWKGEGEQVDDVADEVVVGDQGTEMRGNRGRDREELVGSMLRRRYFMGSEGARERAVKMGWRERGVSGV